MTTTEGNDRADGAGGVGERLSGDDVLPYDKPIPVPDEASRPFFEGTVRGELMLQHCRACGAWMWPLRVRCIVCFSDQLAWEASAGTGTLYSWTMVHQVFHPGFAGEIPYNVAQVDLDEGVRMITNVVGVAPDELRLGMPLEVTFERISADVALPKFRPVHGPEGSG